MRVFNGNIVIEKKGIYALENYIIARRLMYMQVYLHKTVLSADSLLRMIFKRVSDVLEAGIDLHFASPKLEYFVKEKPSAKKKISKKAIDLYAALDDYDVYQNIKDWQYSNDIILADLCTRFLNRDLFRTTFIEPKPSELLKEEVLEKTYKHLVESGFPITKEQAAYYYQFDVNKTEAYKYRNESIWILDDNEAIEFSKAADTKNIIALTEPIVRHFVVHLKSITI